MVDQQRQSDEGRIDGLREVAEGTIRRLYSALRRFFLFPEGHPVRLRSITDLYLFLQGSLSKQGGYSLTSIEDRLYVSRCADVGEESYIASDRMSRDIAHRFSQRGIRSVVFSQGLELGELEAFLNIMATKAILVMARNGAGEMLRSAGNVQHIDIVGAEHGDGETGLAASDNGGSMAGVEEIIISYLRGEYYIGDLAEPEYSHLSSMLEKPDMLARLIEEAVGYDGIRAPDVARVNQCMSNLILLDNSGIGKDKKDFYRKILETGLRVEAPVKDVLFSLTSDDGALSRLVNSLSANDIAKILTARFPEHPDDGVSVPLRWILDGIVSPDRGPDTEDRLTELQTAIESELTRKGQENVFGDRFAPAFEEAFVELMAGGLENDWIELEYTPDQLYPSEEEQETALGKMTTMFIAEDNVIKSVMILMDVLESEAEPEVYSDAVEQLNDAVKALIMESYDTPYIQCRYLISALQILDHLSEQADPRKGKPPELRERVREIIASICTEEVIDHVLSRTLQGGYSDWGCVESFVQQMGEKAIVPLTVNLLDVRNPPERRRFGQILASMGSVVVPELRRRLFQGRRVETLRDIIEILSEIGDAEALGCLADALDHPNPQIRKLAVNSLATNASHEALELLLNKIRDEEEKESIRQLAISALGNIGNEQLAEEIEKVIHEKSVVLKHEEITAVGNIGGEKSISIL